MVASFFPLSKLCKQAPTDVLAFTIWYRSILPMSDPQLDIQKASYFIFATHLLTSYMQKECISAVLWSYPIKHVQIFTQMHSKISIGPSDMYMISAGPK